MYGSVIEDHRGPNSKNEWSVTVVAASISSDGTRSSLLRRAKARDEAAWGEIVDLYAPLVHYWCGRCGLNPDESADCVQDVFWSVARSLGNFESQRSDGSFRAWLWTITANRARDVMRKEGRHQATGGSTAMQSMQLVPDQRSIPDDEPTSELERSQLLLRAIAQIRGEFTERSWEIFERSVVDGIATELVAQQFSITAATVRQTRSRILRRLRQQLGDA